MTSPDEALPKMQAEHMLTQPEPPRVLVVDDNPANLTVFEAILQDSSFELVVAQSGVEAMRQLLHSDFAAILLDINMPSLDGLQTAQLIRERERSRDVPIIFITAYQPDQAQVLAGYATGAVDYLVKPVSPEILKAKVRTFVDLFRKSRQVEWQARQLRAMNLQLRREVAQREAAQRDAVFEREERQRVTLASIGDAVLTLDADGRVLALNPMAESLTGQRSDDVKGAPLNTVLCVIQEGQQQETLEEIVARCLAQQAAVRSVEALRLRRGVEGERYIDYSVAPLQDRDGRVSGAVLVVQDVTVRQEVERERARALRLEQAARKAAEENSRAREEFLAVISHELRTPLNAILGWAHVLRTDGIGERYGRQAADAIHRSAIAQKKLIEDLLDMSRIINRKIQLDRQPVDIAAIVSTAVQTLQPAADEKGVAITPQLSAGPTHALADPARLEQVVWNVLSNAIKFTPAGGHVQVKLECDAGMARIEVRDTGQGIAAPFIGHVFEAFRQADSTTTRQQGGLGLGLAISRQLMALHGGSIVAHSDGVDQGTTVVVSLPLLEDYVADAAEPNGTASPVAGSAALREARVLLIDDDADTLMLLEIALREHGAQVRVASNCRDGIALLQQWRPDVLLSDISMPEEDGYSFIRRVRASPVEDGSRVIALALTAMAGADDRLHALMAGYDGHIAKPVDLEGLVGTLSHLLHRPTSIEQEAS